MDLSRNIRAAVSIKDLGTREDTISKIGSLGMFGWKLGLVSRAGLLGLSCHIHHCYWTRKNRLVHLPGPWFAFISEVLLCLLYVLCKLMNTKLDVS